MEPAGAAADGAVHALFCPENPEAEFEALEGDVRGVAPSGLADPIDGGFVLAETFVGKAEVVHGHQVCGVFG